MTTNHTSQKVRPISPCVQICAIKPATLLCQGCGRTLDEIAAWGSMPESEKAPVWERIEAEGYVMGGVTGGNVAGSAR